MSTAAGPVRPPISSIGPIGWIKGNLLSTWYNALLTLAVLLFLYFLLKGALIWAIFDADWSPIERAVLALATRFARNTYKVTEKDAISLREVGLDDEAYVDILNTVSIQTSLDRLTNTLGVRRDPVPLLPLS